MCWKAFPEGFDSKGTILDGVEVKQAFRQCSRWCVLVHLFGKDINDVQEVDFCASWGCLKHSDEFH
jgi:hypothetical protein